MHLSFSPTASRHQGSRPATRRKFGPVALAMTLVLSLLSVIAP